MIEPASPRARRALKAAGEFWLANGYAPTIHELVEITDYRSTSSVDYAFRQLRRLGLIEWEPMTARSLRLTARGWAESGVAALYVRRLRELAEEILAHAEGVDKEAEKV